MTDRCTITLPRNIKMGSVSIAGLVNRGDKVSVSLGYNGNNTEEFIGYVTYIKPTVPFEIECEDSMFLLKKGVFTKSWANARLDDIVNYILPAGMMYKTFGTVQVGQFSVSNCTAARVLQEIEKVLGLKSFFRTINGVPTLFTGVEYDSDNPAAKYKAIAPVYSFCQNVQKNSLEFRSKDLGNLNIQIKATSMVPNGKNIEYQKGDTDGEMHTLHYYNLPQETLIRRANADYQKLMYDGYRGTLTGWGWPVTNHGDIIHLFGSNEAPIIGSQIKIYDKATHIDNEYDDHYYYADEVTKTFDMSAYKREIKLGPPAAGITDFLGNVTAPDIS